MSIDRERRLLHAIELRARETVADLTAALAVNDSDPLRRLRASAMVLVQDAVKAVRDHEELHDATVTPTKRVSAADLAGDE